MRVIDTGGWAGWDDPPDPRLVWPDAAQFTTDECARLIALRHRVQRGLCDERTPERVRWQWYRWAVRRGLYGR